METKKSTLEVRKQRFFYYKKIFFFFFFPKLASLIIVCTLPSQFSPVIVLAVEN